MSSRDADGASQATIDEPATASQQPVAYTIELFQQDESLRVVPTSPGEPVLGKLRRPSSKEFKVELVDGPDEIELVDASGDDHPRQSLESPSVVDAIKNGDIVVVKEGDERGIPLTAVRVPPVADAVRSFKRKRGTSPPWQFGIVDTTTIKTSDGRRSSARVNPSTNGTPALSESESQSARNSRAASSRLPSPPWREFKAEGSSSIQVDGLRKSGRVNNVIPQRTSPRSKRQTSAVIERPPVKKPKFVEAASDSKIVSTGRVRKPSALVRELEAQIAELQSQSRKGARTGRVADMSSPDRPKKRIRPTSPDQTITSLPKRLLNSPSRLKLRLSSSPRAPIVPPHPLSVSSPPRLPPLLSVWQLLDDVDLREMQQPYTENERGPPNREEFERRHTKAAELEMQTIQKLIRAGEPNGVLSPQNCSIYDEVGPQLEPAKEFAHLDHLASQAIYLRSLQLKEQLNHRQLAKKIANEALEFWKKRQGPTEEDLVLEAIKHQRLIAKQVIADLKAKWDLVWQHVDAHRRAVWEVEQEARRQEKLQRQLAWSQDLLARQRGHLDDQAGEDDSMNDDEDDESDDDDSLDEDENMSDAESESSDDIPDADEGLDPQTLEQYVAQRDAEPPDLSQAIASAHNLDMGTAEQDDSVAQGASQQRRASVIEAAPRASVSIDNEEVVVAHGHELAIGGSTSGKPTNAPVTLHTSHNSEISASGAPARVALEEPELEGLSSDESVDMDSEEYSEGASDDDDSEAGDSHSDDSDASADSGDAATSSGLLGFFSKSDRQAKGLPTPLTSADGEAVAERDQVSSPEPSKQSPAREDRMAEVHEEIVQPDTPSSQSPLDPVAKTLVPQPTLLRGTLRSYQHAGLDWLASLYSQGTNGILADEMGLGKTIQTISLFAHIAEQHNVWDTHLVIVPTSVILNWVTEFQKFLPGFRVLGYYGTTEERQAKRRRWTNDPHHEDRDKRGYNVVVTSYNIALRDITSIRQVQWHYMVLDEAHNIRNFNSQRFQNLIKLKTRARLLLTGTPLQNSLTELWSLLTFLTAGRESADGAEHGSLEEFLARWKEPVNEIFERGVQSLSDEASKVVTQLHTSLRPFMLRRLKADVEKDLPKKTEHVVVCKLSKRQRELYQDYMSLSDTRAKLTQGNAISAGKVLLSLRRVCNHPDLFDPRPIQTSYAMAQSPLEPYDHVEDLVRSMLGPQTQAPASMLLSSLENDLVYRRRRGQQLSASHAMRHKERELERSISVTEPDVSTLEGCQMMLQVQKQRHQLAQLQNQIRYTDDHFATRPIFGSDLREIVTLRGRRNQPRALGSIITVTSDDNMPPTVLTKLDAVADSLLATSSVLQTSLRTIADRCEEMHDRIACFAFCTPEVTSPVLDLLVPSRIQSTFRSLDATFLHESQTRLSINFPDARLLVYDSGKLQRLTVLLRDLQSRGSRSLIFTQMSGTLNVLEHFLGLMGLPYLRLDGSTPVERRQLYSAEFNRLDSKYQCMILSSRAGGVGLNLTGASSVIFYDLDWNPQMDRQCMDRAHRIGQVRDVEVYKLVSEKTVEENILRRANQKSLLDQTVIQEGHFTTDYDLPETGKDKDDVTAAIDRFLSGPNKNFTKAIESIEDKEDVLAAQQARKEETQDDEDFAEKPKEISISATPADVDGIVMDGHIDSYMIRYLEDVVKNIPYAPPVPPRDAQRRKKRAR